MDVRLKRIYDFPLEQDGYRVLVDRLWPRGLRKEDARLDLWAKEIAPTTELRRWFDHDTSKFTEFRIRYLQELEEHPQSVTNVVQAVEGHTLTLLFAAADRHCNHAVILQKYILAACT